MCDLGIGLLAGSFLLQAGSAVAGHKAQNKQSAADKVAAEGAFKQNVADANARGVEETIAAAAEEFQVVQQAERAASSARVSAGEAGVVGASVDAQLGQFKREEGTAQVGIQSNLQRTLAQLERIKRGQLTDMKSRIAASPKANPWLTAMQIGGAGIDLASGINSRRPPSSGK